MSLLILDTLTAGIIFITFIFLAIYFSKYRSLKCGKCSSIFNLSRIDLFLPWKAGGKNFAWFNFVLKFPTKIKCPKCGEFSYCTIVNEKSSFRN